jgi:hypothetical protein
MTQEQARQEADRRVEEFIRFTPFEFEYEYAVRCAIISINREIELLDDINNVEQSMYIYRKWNDLNQIKDELLKM